ncbi:MAG: sialidase family protein [Candidatus Nanopelagicales bacterium]
MPAAGATARVVWRSPVTVAAVWRATAYYTGLDLAASADARRLVAVWRTRDDVYAAASADSGATWSTPVTVNAAPCSGALLDAPRVAASTDGGRAVIVFTCGAETQGPALFAATSADGGRTWAAATRLSEATWGTQDLNPVVAVSADGSRAIAAWDFDPYASSDPVGNRIQASSSVDGGATWSTPSDIDAYGTSRSIRDLQLAASVAGDRVTLLWRSFSYSSGGPAEVRYATTLDSGTTWGPAATLTVAEGAWFVRSAASQDGTRLTVAWSAWNGSHGVLTAATSSDTGGTWTVPVRVSAKTQDVPTAALWSSASGQRLSLAWTWRSGSRSKAVLSASSRDGGRTWTTPTTLSLPKRQAKVPSVAASGDGRRVYVAWEQADGGSWPAYARTSVDGGRTWTARVRLSPRGGVGGTPQLAVTPNGARATAVWAFSNESRYAIQSSRGRLVG